MEIVVSRNRAPVFAAPFSGIALEYAQASRTTTPATVTNHLVRCSRSVIISSPYVVPKASLLGRRTYLNARYSTLPELQSLRRFAPYKTECSTEGSYYEAVMFLYTCVRKGFLDTTVLNAGISFNERPENVLQNAKLVRSLRQRHQRHRRH
jgi:hypothetical protein